MLRIVYVFNFPKLDGNGSPFGGVCASMNGTPQIVLIAQLAPVGDACFFAIKDQHKESLEYIIIE